MPLKGFRIAPVNSLSQWQGLLLLLLLRLQQRPLGTQVCNVHSSTHPFFSIAANPAPRVAGGGGVPMGAYGMSISSLKMKAFSGEIQVAATKKKLALL